MHVNLQFNRDWVSASGHIFRAGRIYTARPRGWANVLIRRGIAQKARAADEVQPQTHNRAKRRARQSD
jgi:hypothetical protein